MNWVLKFKQMTSGKNKHYGLNILLKYGAPICVFTPLLVVLLCVFLAANGWWGVLPKFQELENPESNLATEILSTDNEVIGKYFYENRTHIEYKDLSPHLINALIATEDERFFNHSGIDFIALIRVLKGVLTVSFLCEVFHLLNILDQRAQN